MTCEQSIKIVEETLSQKLSPKLAGLLNEFWGKGQAIPGTEVFQAERLRPKGQDIGFVGPKGS